MATNQVNRTTTPYLSIECLVLFCQIRLVALIHLQHIFCAVSLSQMQPNLTYQMHIKQDILGAAKGTNNIVLSCFALVLRRY